MACNPKPIWNPDHRVALVITSQADRDWPAEACLVTEGSLQDVTSVVHASIVLAWHFRRTHRAVTSAGYGLYELCHDVLHLSRRPILPACTSASLWLAEVASSETCFVIGRIVCQVRLERADLQQHRLPHEG